MKRCTWDEESKRAASVGDDDMEWDKTFHMEKPPADKDKGAGVEAPRPKFLEET